MPPHHDCSWYMPRREWTDAVGDVMQLSGCTPIADAYLCDGGITSGAESLPTFFWSPGATPWPGRLGRFANRPYVGGPPLTAGRGARSSHTHNLIASCAARRHE